MSMTKLHFKDRILASLPLLIYGLLLALIFLSVCFILSLIINVPSLGVPLLAFQSIVSSVMPIIFICFFTIATILPVLLIIKQRNETIVTQENSSSSLLKNLPNYRYLLIVSMIIIVFLLSERLFRFNFLTGGDTPYYIISFEDILNKGISLSWLSRMAPTRFFSLVFSPILGLNLSPEVIMKILPPLIGVFYALSVFFFFKNINKQLAAIASMLAGLTSSVLILSAQLYENFFAIVIMTLFFAFYLRAVENRQLKNIILAAILQFVLLQIYSPAWLLSVSIVIVFLVVSFLSSRRRFHLLVTTLKVYLPSILVIVIGPFLLSQIWDYYKLYNYYVSSVGFSLNSSGGLFSAIMNGGNAIGSDFQPFLMENSIILILSLVGAIVLLFQARELNVKDNIRSFIVAWVFVPSLLLPLFSYGRYRYTLYYPFPILASFAIFFALLLLSRRTLALWPNHSRFLSRFRVSQRTKLLVPLSCVIIVLFSFSYIRLIYSPLISSPLERYADELYWIHSNFNPKTTIVCVGDYIYNPPVIYESEVAWVQAITDSYIYVGRIADLLSGIPDNATYPWVSSAPLADRPIDGFTILVLSRGLHPGYYSIDTLELQILQEVHSNVYEIKPLTSAEKNSWIDSWYLSSSLGNLSIARL